MPLAETLLVDAQAQDRLGATALETAADGALEHAVHLIPTQRKQLGDALLAGLAQPSDRQRLEQRGEVAAGLGPRQPGDARAVLGAVAARRRGV